LAQLGGSHWCSGAQQKKRAWDYETCAQKFDSISDILLALGTLDKTTICGSTASAVFHMNGKMNRIHCCSELHYLPKQHHTSHNGVRRMHPPGSASKREKHIDQ
jgi:hypothetical protein